eukprot:COSAG01_NODE_48565_length_380_cov_0.533808_2_plen_40_part_01
METAGSLRLVLDQVAARIHRAHVHVTLELRARRERVSAPS